VSVERPVLYVFRHGETDWNAEHRFQGWSDRPLNARGRAEARDLGKRLSAVIGAGGAQGFDLVTSPLARAAGTMEIAAGALGRSDWRAEPAMREVRFGRWEGLTTHQVKAAFPDERRARKADRWHFRPQGGESLADVRDRLRPWSAALDRPTIVATHAGVLRVLFVLMGAMTREAALLVPVRHAALFRFDGTTVTRLD
jgi:broad specificity phosphatase PhoE